jgi:type III secretory pathway component EscT
VPDAAQALATWALLGARIAPSGLLIALLSRGALPVWLGLAFACAIGAGLSVGLAPPALASTAQPVLVAFARELVIGACFASAALVPLLALGAALRLVQGSEPWERSPWSTLYSLAALALTLSLGGLRAYVRALSESLAVLPLAASQAGRGQLLLEVQTIVTQAIAVACSLALPLLSALWLLDLCLALVLRVAHANGRVEALPLRRALLLGLLALLCAPLVSRLPELTRAGLTAALTHLPRLAK